MNITHSSLMISAIQGRPISACMFSCMAAPSGRKALQTTVGPLLGGVRVAAVAHLLQDSGSRVEVVEGGLHTLSSRTNHWCMAAALNSTLANS